MQTPWIALVTLICSFSQVYGTALIIYFLSLPNPWISLVITESAPFPDSAPAYSPLICLLLIDLWLFNNYRKLFNKSVPLIIKTYCSSWQSPDLESDSVPNLICTLFISGIVHIICILSQINKSHLWSHPMLLPIPKQCFLHLTVKRDDIFLITEHCFTLFSNQTPGAQICPTIRNLVILISAKQRKGGGTYPNLSTRSLAHKLNAGLLLPPAGPQIKCIFLSYTVWNYWLQWLNTSYEKSGVGGVLVFFLCLFPLSSHTRFHYHSIRISVSFPQNVCPSITSVSSFSH